MRIERNSATRNREAGTRHEDQLPGAGSAPAEPSRASSRLGGSLALPSIGTAASGFSLLEVVLALAILAGAFAALGEVMRLGDRNAEQARDETRAELLADSVMSELVAGARMLGNVTDTFDLATEPPWKYSIVVEPTEFIELVAVRVSVAQHTTPELDPARCDLVRWLPNPDYLPAETSDTSSGGQL